MPPSNNEAETPQSHINDESRWIERLVNKAEAAGVTAPYVDLTGPEQGGRPAERTLAVSIPHGEQTWFFKLTGPASLVAEQKQAFDGFLKSVRFEK